LNANFVEELEEQLINKEDNDEVIDKVIDSLERAVNKEIENLREDLKHATPQEYWMLQGEIRGLKRLIDEQLKL
jgi:hypothetical protein